MLHVTDVYNRVYLIVKKRFIHSSKSLLYNSGHTTKQTEKGPASKKEAFGLLLHYNITIITPITVKVKARHIVIQIDCC
jgi:hypothetical protein